MDTKRRQRVVDVIWGDRGKHIRHKGHTDNHSDKKELPRKEQNQGNEEDNDRDGSVKLSISLLVRSTGSRPLEPHLLFISLPCPLFIVLAPSEQLFFHSL